MTDSGTEITYDEKKTGLYNLINIYAAYTDKTPLEIENSYQGKMYSDFKNDLAEIIIESLKPFQSEYNKIFSDKNYLDNLLADGRDKARYHASKTLNKVYLINKQLKCKKIARSFILSHF